MVQGLGSPGTTSTHQSGWAGKRTAVLDEAGNVRIRAAEVFGKENDTQVAKVAWLSNREVAKAYGSAGYLPQQGIGRRRLLQKGFSHTG